MLIKWFGHASFQIDTSAGTIITDPFNDELGYPMFPRRADVVTVSHQHWDHNTVENVSGSPQVFSAPGFYQLEGMSIQGFPTFHDQKSGQERGGNTVFKISTEEINLLHLGDLGHILSQETAIEIGVVDILLLPVGGNFTVDADAAYEIVGLLRPRIVIPMHFQTPHLSFRLAPVEEFTGKYEKVLKLPSLEISSQDLPNETQIIVLDYLMG
ncbi:MAG: MBL fold metallo-hydrolase [Syntrophomonadaceae bacterium]|nr:MBL fold metallo-hydrolase [Syntrophomonadaceae bacterium]